MVNKDNTRNYWIIGIVVVVAAVFLFGNSGFTGAPILSADGGTSSGIYTHWGSSSCAIGDERIYTGVASINVYILDQGSEEPITIPAGNTVCVDGSLPPTEHGIAGVAPFVSSKPEANDPGESEVYLDLKCAVCERK